MLSFRYSLMLILVIFTASCRSGKVKKPVVLEDVITDFMGQRFEKASNSSNTLVLTWNTRLNNDTPVLYYAVWNKKTAEKVYSGSAIRGEVRWLSDTSLELYDYPGIIDDNNPLYKYKIDLNTQTKTALREEDKF